MTRMPESPVLGRHGLTPPAQPPAEHELPSRGSSGGRPSYRRPGLRVRRSCTLWMATAMLALRCEGRRYSLPGGDKRLRRSRRCLCTMIFPRVLQSVVVHASSKPSDQVSSPSCIFLFKLPSWTLEQSNYVFLTDCSSHKGC
jgi:hypothetical protein